MNRAERRRKGIKQAPPRMKHITEQEYREALNLAYRQGFDAAYKKAANCAVGYMLGIPLLVLHERFGDVRRKDKRIERFFDMCVDLFDEYTSEGNDLIEKLLKDVSEKTGFDISKRVQVEDER